MSNWCREKNCYCNNTTAFGYCKTSVCIKSDNAPTVNAEPVRHGHWVRNDNGTYSCSECQSWIPNEQYYYARYCLHCGAKMDRKGEEDDGI